MIALTWLVTSHFLTGSFFYWLHFWKFILNSCAWPFLLDFNYISLFLDLLQALVFQYYLLVILPITNLPILKSGSGSLCFLVLCINSTGLWDHQIVSCSSSLHLFLWHMIPIFLQSKLCEIPFRWRDRYKNGGWGYILIDSLNFTLALGTVWN